MVGLGIIKLVMNQEMGSILALIPAKAASKRIPRKNLRQLGGKSLLSWTVQVAIAAKVFDKIVVSTEDQEIAEEAQQLGAEVPFIRPEKLSVDPAGVVEVSLHALNELEAQGYHFKTLVILLPSSPFRSVSDISASLKCYSQSEAGFLMSVTKLEDSPLSALKLDDQGLLTPLHPEWIHRLGAKEKHEVMPCFVKCNGAITIVDVEQFKRKKRYYVQPLVAYQMPWTRGLDIDTEQDLLLGEFLLDRSLISEKNLLAV